jgi:hypothetical protein
LDAPIGVSRRQKNILGISCPEFPNIHCIYEHFQTPPARRAGARMGEDFFGSV